MLKVKYEPFQKKGVQLMTEHYKRNNHFILADQTGLGKGVQGLGVAENFQNEKILILCRSFIKPKWIDELRTKVKNSTNSYYIYTYSQLRDPNILKIAKRLKYKLALIDEFHHLKGVDTQQTQAVLGENGLIHNCKKSMAISATPFEKVGEVFPYLQAIRHPMAAYGYENFVKKWAESYRKIKISEYKKIMIHEGVSEDIYLLKEGLKNMILRRKKSEVRKHIKEGVRKFIQIKLDSKWLSTQEKIFRDSGFTESDIIDLMDSEYLDAHLDVIPELEKFSRFKVALGNYKIPFVMKKMQPIIESLVKNNEQIKFIFYAQHKKILDSYSEQINELLKKYIKKHKYKKDFPLITKIAYDVNPDDRFDLARLADYTENSILFATMGSLSEGIDLVNFSKSYFSETNYTIKSYEQLEGRTDRLYSKQQSHYFNFIADTALEKHIMKILSVKKKTQEAII